jgi:hypothetical protein
MKFDIAWPRRYHEKRRQEYSCWLTEAVLLERRLLDGRPQMQLVCRLAAIDEDRIGDVEAQEKFWHDARARLGRLCRLTDRDLDGIEALLARRIVKPVPVPVPVPAA